MSNIINEEINKMLYLFGYKPGKVLSEQTIPKEIDEARSKAVDVKKETSRIFNEIKDRVIDNNEIMWSDFETLHKKDKDKTLINSLSPYYRDKLKMYDGLSPKDRDNTFNTIMSKAEENGDVPLQDVMFVSKYYQDNVDDLKSLFTFDNPFSNVTKEDKILTIVNNAKKTREISHKNYQFLRNNKPSALEQIKPFISKQIGRKKYMTDDILLDRLIEIEDRIKTEKDIRRRDYSYLLKNAPELLEELKPYWGKNVKQRNLPEDELNKRYDTIIETCKRIKDIYASDFAFLTRRNPELLEKLRVYWGRYTAKPKSVVPEPVIEPEPTTDDTTIGRKRGRPRKDITEPVIEPEPTTDDTTIGRKRGRPRKDITEPVVSTMKMGSIDRKQDELSQMSGRGSEPKPEYEKMGKLSDYWSSPSSTLDFDSKYNYNEK